MRRLLILLYLASLWAPGAHALDLMVEALLPGTAVIVIDGTRKTLRAGQAYKGLTLISADATAALVEVNGERRSLRMNQRVSARFQTPELRKVDIPRNAALQYRTSASINGRRIDVLVDTGANIVAMNSGHARALGLNYQRDGQPARMETASGTVAAYALPLQSVDVGGIRVEQVQALVTEGNFPSTVLLGMTYLRHVKLEESNGVLSLSRQW